MKIFNNLFDNDLLLEILKYSQTTKEDGSKGNYWTNSSWPEDILKDSGIVLCSDIREEFGQQLFETCVKNKVFVRPDGVDLGVPTNSAIMLYNWQRYSYIPFHMDSHAEVGTTLYVNTNWDEDWGGAQIVENGDTNELRLEYPEFNKMCVNYSYQGERHSTTMVHPSAPDRVCVQMFFSFDEDSRQYEV